jgi:hypothetical protein
MEVNSIHYRACDSDCAGCGFVMCSHQHQTVAAAAACISMAGGYVVVVENGVIRALTAAEEQEFQVALHGTKVESKAAPGPAPSVPVWWWSGTFRFPA